MATIYGDEKDNSLKGSAVSDEIYGQGGDDTLRGVGGDDVLCGGSDADVLDGGDGDDQINVWDGGPNDDDVASGGDGDDTIRGGDGADRLDGGDGDDRLIFVCETDNPIDTGLDTLSGGGGFDRLELSVRSASRIVSFAEDRLVIDGRLVALTDGFESATFSGTEGAQDVTGSEGDDYISADPFVYDDRLFGMGGDDTIVGGAGRDLIEGGAGNDTVELTLGGRDKVRLGGGDDVLEAGGSVSFAEQKGVGSYDGGAGYDVLDLNFSAEDRRVEFDGAVLTVDGQTIVTSKGFEAIEVSGSRVIGLAGDDHLDGTSRNDRLSGGDGDDDIEGLTGADTLSGGDGDDVVRALLDSRRDVLTGGAGQDELNLDRPIAAIVMTGDLATGVTIRLGDDVSVIAKGFETIDAEEDGQGDDSFLGGVGGDDIVAGTGRDVVRTFLGDDTVALDLDLIADKVDVGRGTDVSILRYRQGEDVDMRFAGDEVTVSLGGSVAAVVKGAERYEVETGSGDDRLSGGDRADRLEAGGGENALLGRGGDDLLGVSLDGALDIVDGGSGDDVLIATVGADLSGRFGQPLITHVTGEGAFTLSLGGETLLDARSIEAVYMTDTSSSDLLIGQALNDVLRATYGLDTLIGGGGDDTLFASAGGGELSGGDGSDTATFESRFSPDGVKVTLVAGEGVTAFLNQGRTEVSLDGVENIVGTSAADDITGDDGDNVIEGGEGEDVLNGGRGVDTLSYAGSRNPIEITLRGTLDAEISIGNTLDGYSTEIARSFENVVGSYYSDAITGDERANRLTGGEGADSLTGGGGADVFAFANDDDPYFRAQDLILDFSVADGDRIDLSAIAIDPSLPAASSLHFIGRSGFTGAGGEVRAQTNKLTTTLYIDVDGDQSADKTIAFVGRVEFSVDDFILT